MVVNGPEGWRNRMLLERTVGEVFEEIVGAGVVGEGGMNWILGGAREIVH